MLEFSDQGYRYFPPKPNRWVEGAVRWLNKAFILPGKGHRISEVVVDNPEVVSAARAQAGKRLLFLPNHPTHSDPQIMTEVLRQMKTQGSFMAAYDVFLRGRFAAWCMQRMGCFSVDRDGSDHASMKEAVGILKSGKRSLVIFPEGNVYLMNDSVTPFLEGPAFIGLKAQKELGEETSVLAIPVSIKVTHLTDARPAVNQLLERLALKVGAEINQSTDVLVELVRLGLLAVQKVLSGLLRSLPEGAEHEYVFSTLRNVASEMIENLEDQLDIVPAEGEELTNRIRKVRRKVHSLRIADPPTLADFKARTLAAEAMVAYRLLTYPGDYLITNPTLDRMSETVEKILEDLRSEPLPPLAPRRALVRFGDPIDLVEERKNANDRSLVATLTKRFESEVQTGVDHLNAENDCLGAELFRQ
tara:strand:- start:8082 stop:9329 length:1248 start_codon:yes stop_codon:yes gene_type:complete